MNRFGSAIDDPILRVHQSRINTNRSGGRGAAARCGGGGAPQRRRRRRDETLGRSCEWLRRARRRAGAEGGDRRRGGVGGDGDRRPWREVEGRRRCGGRSPKISISKKKYTHTPQPVRPLLPSPRTLGPPVGASTLFPGHSLSVHVPLQTPAHSSAGQMGRRTWHGLF